MFEVTSKPLVGVGELDHLGGGVARHRGGLEGRRGLETDRPNLEALGVNVPSHPEGGVLQI